MKDKSIIESLTNELLLGSDLFLVEVKISPANDIEVVLDSDSKVNIDQCITISKALEEKLDRETEDFALTVCSAGVGQPLKLLRQLTKTIDKPIEMVLNNGLKIIGELKQASDNTVTVQYQTKEAVEGKKRKENVEHTDIYNISDIKTIKEELLYR